MPVTTGAAAAGGCVIDGTHTHTKNKTKLARDAAAAAAGLRCWKKKTSVSLFFCVCCIAWPCVGAARRSFFGARARPRLFGLVSLLLLVVARCFWIPVVWCLVCMCVNALKKSTRLAFTHPQQTKMADIKKEQHDGGPNPLGNT